MKISDCASQDAAFAELALVGTVALKYRDRVFGLIGTGRDPTKEKLDDFQTGELFLHLILVFSGFAP
jgi:hypothetical protein